MEEDTTWVYAGGGVLFAFLVAGLARFKASGGLSIKTISYVGDGNASHLISIPFLPKYVVFNLYVPPGSGQAEVLTIDIGANQINSGFPAVPANFPLSPVSSYVTATSIDVGKLSAAGTSGINNSGKTFYMIIYA